MQGARSFRRAWALAAVVLLVAAGVLVLALGGGRGGRVIFDGDFAQGLGPWSGRIHAERIAIVDDPILRATRKVARMTVLDSDLGPTANPRAQLESSAELEAGEEYWIGWSTLFPEDFPQLPSDGWLTFESVYGPPNRGAGPLAVRLTGNELRFERNATYGYDVAWRRPLLRGRWLDFVMHVRLSRDPDRGFVELYLNEGDGFRKQPLFGRDRLTLQTLDASNDVGPNRLHINNYRRRGMVGSATIFQARPRIGTSFDAVRPESYPD